MGTELFFGTIRQSKGHHLADRPKGGMVKTERFLRNSYFIVMVLMTVSAIPASRAQEMATFSYDSSTGAFSLSVPRTSGPTLDASGNIVGANITLAVQLEGGSTSYTVTSTTVSGGKNVSILYGSIGQIDYFVPTLGEPSLSYSNFSSAQCTALGDDPLFLALHEVFSTMHTVNRTWQNSGQAAQIRNVLDSLGFYLFGPEAVIDCQSFGYFINEKGCDFLHGLDCTNVGKCCDYHDECWRFNDCTLLSWFDLSGACKKCNQDVVDCFGLGIIGGPGPSSCCARGDCGQANRYPGGVGGTSRVTTRRPW